MIGVMFLLYPFFRLGGLGAGDVKLLGICAGYFHRDKILSFLFCSLLIAAIFALIKMMTEHCTRERLKMRIPLAGPVLCSVLLSAGGVY